jgi:hypothetical protein
MRSVAPGGRLMCDTVGVAKRIDVERISKEIANLIKELDAEVQLPVHEVKRLASDLEQLVAPKP